MACCNQSPSESSDEWTGSTAFAPIAFRTKSCKSPLRLFKGANSLIKAPCFDQSHRHVGTRELNAARRNSSGLGPKTRRNISARIKITRSRDAMVATIQSRTTNAIGKFGLRPALLKTFKHPSCIFTNPQATSYRSLASVLNTTKSQGCGTILARRHQ
jgi:hypothetical protein